MLRTKSRAASRVVVARGGQVGEDPTRARADSLDVCVGLIRPSDGKILPLMGGRSISELIATLLDSNEAEGAKIIRRTADKVRGDSLSDREWRKLLHDGYSDDVKVAVGESLPLQQSELVIRGHAFEARIYAEDTDNQFLPQTGTLHYYAEPEASETVRVDSALSHS